MERQLAEWNQKADQTKAELADRVNTNLKIQGKLNKAGLGEHYVAYRLLCAFVHTNLTSLIARHADQEPILRYRDPVPEPVLVMLLGIAMKLLMNAVVTLPKFSSIGADEVDALMAEASEKWERVSV